MWVLQLVMIQPFVIQLGRNYEMNPAALCARSFNKKKFHNKGATSTARRKIPNTDFSGEKG